MSTRSFAAPFAATSCCPTTASEQEPSPCRSGEFIWFALLILAGWSQAGYALDQEQQRGNVLLKTLCAGCHAVGATTGQSPHPEAPPFRDFGEKLYDDDLGQRLQDGLTTIHPDMPTFHFKRRDAQAAVNYLKSIQQKNQSKRTSKPSIRNLAPRAPVN
jgi:mono/diheme cytochrome c family protein